MNNIKKNKLLRALLLTWVVFQLYFATFGAMDAIIFRAYHAMFLIFFSLLSIPITKEVNKENVLSSSLFRLVNWIIILLAIFSFSYFIINFNRLALSGGYLSPVDKLVAGIGIFTVFESARRASKNLAILALVFLSYLFWGRFVGGELATANFTISRVLSHMFWGSQGIFGIGIGVSATYIFLFVVFGSFLKHSGFSNFINDISMALVGRSPGGPAKVAVIASAFMGMMNGSAIANVATTGTITIPLMKKTGYSKDFAAAVEAVSSTGGQFCPPIMGAVGFVMAEYLGIPYTKVMLAAILPAFLYYLGLMISVHLEAKSLGLSGVSKENIPNAILVFKERGHLLLPLFVLLFMMFLGFTPVMAAVCSIFSTIIAANLRKSTKMGLGKIIEAAIEGAISSLSVGISCILIGLIIGTVSLSGLGINFGNLIIRLAGNNSIFFIAFMVMVMSVILGMGVPGVAAYVIVVAVAVPVLVGAGANPIAAHMFCLIYACLSNITPPVAMSSYVASGIANSNMTKTSLIALRIGISGFIVPFFFLQNPILLLDGVGTYPILEIFRGVFTAVVGVIALATASQGLIFAKLTMVERTALFLAGLSTIDKALITDIGGVVVIGLIFLYNFLKVKRPKIEKYKDQTNLY